MRGALGGPRLLLRRLREVMAEPVSAQARLDKIVILIAQNMVAEVCSVYVLRADSRSNSTPPRASSARRCI
jgi:phosphotransferase system enzyme I (PtsP)